MTTYMIIAIAITFIYFSYFVGMIAYDIYLYRHAPKKEEETFDVSDIADAAPKVVEEGKDGFRVDGHEFKHFETDLLPEEKKPKDKPAEVKSATSISERVKKLMNNPRLEEAECWMTDGLDSQQLNLAIMNGKINNCPEIKRTLVHDHM